VLPDGRPIWPSLDLASPDDELRRRAAAGLAARYGEPAPPAVVARLAHETEVIVASGFAPLFLVVAQIVRFARDAGIPVSTRGSVANSLAAYCLGITTVDPVAHDLLFERFLNPARHNPPDIDLDFCSRRRDEVLDYARRTFGAERVALVSTMNTFQPRSAVRETGKARGLSDEAISTLVAALPHGWHPDPRRRLAETPEDVIGRVADPAHREVLREAYRLVGQPHHPGLHPGGLVMTPGPLTDVVPVLLSPKGFLATQFEHTDAEAIGLPKLDLLGIRALTVLADAVELVRRHHAPNFRLEDIPVAGDGAGDAATAAILSTGETIGVFQCESDGARRTLRQLRAADVADLAVAGAFFKPGPATGGMARAFVRRYRGEERVAYLHPALEPILGRTKGVLLFQEQVLRVAVEIAGLSWAQADRLRRGMSKFQAAEMDALAAAFADGCCRAAPDGPGFSREQAAKLWEQVMAFAGYGFNQGHATAYADVSYRSAYVKAHWPAEFLAARLADAGGFHHPAVYVAEAQRLDIAVRPPHVNASGEAFTLTYEHETDDDRPEGWAARAMLRPTLWMGLGQVRDLRRASIRAIIDERMVAPFTGVDDLAARVSLSPKELNHLIRCGALDGLGPSRTALLEETGGRAGARGRAGGGQMRFDFMNVSTVQGETVADRLSWETELVGRPVSVHPLERVARRRDDVSLRLLPDRSGRKATILVVRIPGWPGGAGFFAGDGDTFVIARPDAALAAQRVRWPSWQPMRLRGRWLRDEWDGGWFDVEAYEWL
jgi:DNA-directed DNA polymerase III PolC